MEIDFAVFLVLVVIVTMNGFELIESIQIKKLLKLLVATEQHLLNEIKENSQQTKVGTSLNEQLRNEMFRQLQETRSFGTTLSKLYASKKSSDDDDGR